MNYIPQSVGDMMSTDDYIHVDNAVEVVLENGWLSMKDILFYIKDSIYIEHNYPTARYDEADIEEIKYLKELRDLLNKVDFTKLNKKVIADIL